MRLCFVISSLGSGGAERVLSQLANHFSENKKYDVHILTLQPDTARPFYSLNPNITLHQLGLTQTGGVLGKIKRVFWYLLVIRNTIKIIRPDNIISFMDEMNIIVLLATLGLRQKTIISERIDPRFQILSFISNILRRFLYPLAKMLVLQGEYITSYFPYMKNKCSVIPNPIPESKYVCIYKNINKKIINVGRLNFQKNQAMLIKAFSTLAHKYPEWSLEIYGEGTEKKNLDHLISEYSLVGKVFLRGVTHSIQEKLSQSTIFVFPSLFEGFPNALGEAMSVGLPVIVSDCGGNLELVQHEKNGLVFPARELEALITCLDELMSSSEQRESLGINAKTSIKKFSPHTIYQQWEALFRD